MKLIYKSLNKIARTFSRNQNIKLAETHEKIVPLNSKIVYETIINLNCLRYLEGDLGNGNL